jgi:hypothetical protein
MVNSNFTEKDVIKAYELARQRFDEAEKEVKKYVKKDPAKAMLIAAGVGAAIGAILMLSLKERKEEKL